MSLNNLDQNVTKPPTDGGDTLCLQFILIKLVIILYFQFVHEAIRDIIQTCTNGNNNLPKTQTVGLKGLYMC